MKNIKIGNEYEQEKYPDKSDQDKCPDNGLGPNSQDTTKIDPQPYLSCIASTDNGKYRTFYSLKEAVDNINYVNLNTTLLCSKKELDLIGAKSYVLKFYILIITSIF